MHLSMGTAKISLCSSQHRSCPPTSDSIALTKYGNHCLWKKLISILNCLVHQPQINQFTAPTRVPLCTLQHVSAQLPSGDLQRELIVSFCLLTSIPISGRTPGVRPLCASPWFSVVKDHDAQETGGIPRLVKLAYGEVHMEHVVLALI